MINRLFWVHIPDELPCLHGEFDTPGGEATRLEYTNWQGVSVEEFYRTSQ